jgi:ATP-dependent Zn protease
MNRQQRRDAERRALKANKVPDEETLVAIHEAGHAVVQELLGAAPVTFLDLQYQHKAGELAIGAKTGHQLITPDEFAAMEDDALMKYMAVTMAGINAEHIFLSRVHPKWDASRRQAMAASEGDGDSLGNLEFVWVDLKKRPKAEFEVLLQKAGTLALRTLEQHWQMVVDVADAALDRQRLTGEEICAIMGKNGR